MNLGSEWNTKNSRHMPAEILQLWPWTLIADVESLVEVATARSPLGNFGRGIQVAGPTNKRQDCVIP